jgi:HAD superfamily hydrolase (TIGR01509 family)
MARIALDIDSTLHHYWDLLQRVARDRYGVELPYEEQRDWGITALERDAVIHCVEETHSDANIEAAEPYPGAVDAVRRWHDQGHWIHVTSHRRDSAAAATARWLDAIGMPYDDLHCSFDKVSRCIELGVDVLIDDSPVNIERARQAGMVAATIVHPWNEDLIGVDGVVGARTWPELEQRLRPVLARL